MISEPVEDVLAHGMRMNRTIKDATVRRRHYDNHAELRMHLADFVGADNDGRRLETLRRLARAVDRFRASARRFTNSEVISTFATGGSRHDTACRLTTWVELASRASGCWSRVDR